MTLYHQTHIGTRCIIIYGKIQLQSVRISMLHFMGLSGAKVTKLVDVGSSRESRTAGQHVPTADTIPSPSRLQFASLRLLTFSLSLAEPTEYVLVAAKHKQYLPTTPLKQWSIRLIQTCTLWGFLSAMQEEHTCRMHLKDAFKLTSLMAVHSMPFPSIPRGQSPHKNSVSVTLVHSTALLKHGYTSGSRHGSACKREKESERERDILNSPRK